MLQKTAFVMGLVNIIIYIVRIVCFVRAELWKTQQINQIYNLAELKLQTLSSLQMLSRLRFVMVSLEQFLFWESMLLNPKSWLFWRISWLGYSG